MRRWMTEPGHVNTDVIATELLDALDGNATIGTVTGRDPGFDVDAAYRVSAEILRRRRARGEKPIGRKIGFTNRTIWAEYGVAVPIWACVYDSTVTYFDEPGGRLAIGHLVQPRIEPEIVLHFKSAPRVTEDESELLSCVDWIAHGYEVVQCHYPDWKFGAADAIAAFGLHGALVVGPRRPVEGRADVIHKLRTFTITLARNGRMERQGGGSNVLDSPLLAVAHLLDVLKDQQGFEPLQAGELVTTGSLTSPAPIRSGETWNTDLSGIELPGLHLRLE
jgi:2-oxo-3-hexenedioate decarboxylase